MSQSSGAASPFRVVYSGLCRETSRQLLLRAAAKGRFAEIAQAFQRIETRLGWIPLDFGEPLRDFANLGVQVRIGSVAPLVVKYGVDERRRIVYVSRPFGLLPNSGI